MTNDEVCGICKKPHFFGGTDFIHNFKFCNKCLHQLFGRLIIDKLDDIAIELNLMKEFRTIIKKYKQKYRLSLEGII